MENVINIGSTDYWNGYIVLYRNRVSFYRVTAMDYSEMEEAIRDSWRPAEDWREEVSEWYTDVWLEEYLEDYEYAYAGLNTSNILCEIIAKSFDSLITQKFKDAGLILYKRYIDDGVIVFNRYIILFLYL